MDIWYGLLTDLVLKDDKLYPKVTKTYAKIRFDNLRASLLSLYILISLFVSLYLSAFVRPALFVLTHFSRYCVCIAPSFFRILRTVMSWNFSNTSLWISPAWKSMLHESLRNFALARSPEIARFSGRLEHPMYIFSV